MKTRLAIVLLICFSCTTVASAQNKQIKTDTDAWKDIGRSLLRIPVLSHDGNTIYIYSDLPLENMVVTVTDASGYTVYTGVLSVGAGGTVSFTFNDTGDGEYMIEVTHGRKYLCGWFDLE